MKRIKKLCLYAAIALSAGFVGCNLFNPTESVNIDSDDTDALTYEGYIHFRNSEYSIARVYFERTLAVDSTISEAWYGLAKCILNQQKLNVFELLKYANNKDGQNALANMDSVTANHYIAAIDSVMLVLDPFIQRDTTGRTDGKVTYKTISASYTVLHLTKAALLFNKSRQNLTQMFQVTTDPLSINIDWSSLKELGESSVEMFETIGDIGQAIKADPSIAADVIRAYVPEADAFVKDSLLTLAAESMADYMINASDAVTENEDAILTYTSVGDRMDSDGDGCIDEEILDYHDNDGDGLVDEDMRDNKLIVLETDITKHKLGQVKSINTNEFYDLVDIDGNGIPGEIYERTFYINDNSNSRDAAQDYRIVTFVNLTWYFDLDARKVNMDKAKKDTNPNNIQYDLKWRQDNIGGCWNNYTEETFLKWFEGRN